MAENKKEVSFLITAQDRASKVIKAFGKQLGGLKTKVGDMAKGVMLGQLAYDALTRSLSLTTNFLKGAVVGAMEDEVAFGMLAGTVRKAGLNMEQVVPQVENLANSMIDLGFDNTDTTKSFTKLIGVTRNVDQAMRLTKLAADMARKGNVNITEATNDLANVLIGKGARALMKYKVQMQEGASTAEMLAALQDKAKDSATIFAETSAGKIEILKARWGLLKETIGKAFLPTLTMAIKETDKYVSSAQRQIATTNSLGKVIYFVANFLRGTVEMVRVFGIALAGVGQVMIGTSQIVWAFHQDVFNAFSNIATMGQTVFKALKEAATGHFEEAGNTIRNFVRLTFTSTTGAFSGLMAGVNSIADDINNAWSNATKYFGNAFYMNGYVPVTDAVNELPEDFGQAFNDIENAVDQGSKDAAEKAKQNFEEMSSSWKENLDKQKTSLTDWKSKFSETIDTLRTKLKDLKKTHKESIDGMKADIQEEINNFNNSQQERNQSFDESLADVLKSHQENLSAKEKMLQEELARGKDADQQRLVELRTEISAEKTILQENATDIARLKDLMAETDIERMKRKNAEEIASENAKHQQKLTDLQTAIETENTKFEEQRKKIDKQWSKLIDKSKDKIQEFRKTFKESFTDMSIKYKEFVDDINKISQESKIEDVFKKVIEYIKTIKSEGITPIVKKKTGAKKQMGGYIDQTGLYTLHAGERVIPASQNSGSRFSGTINLNMGGVTVNNEADENRLVKKIQDTLSRQLVLSEKGLI